MKFIINAHTHACTHAHTLPPNTYVHPLSLPPRELAIKQLPDHQWVYSTSTLHVHHESPSLWTQVMALPPSAALLIAVLGRRATVRHTGR